MPGPIALFALVLALFVAVVWLAWRAGRLLLVLPIASMVVAGLLVAGWSGLGEHQDLGWADELQGSMIEVGYMGSECEDQRSVSFTEDTHQVRVSVIARTFATGCSDVGVERSVVLDLAAPLGNRKVVDAGCHRRPSRCVVALRH